MNVDQFWPDEKGALIINSNGLADGDNPATGALPSVADQLWPVEAREAVRSVITDWDRKTVVEWSEDGVTDAVLAALSVHTVPAAELGIVARAAAKSAADHDEFRMAVLALAADIEREGVGQEGLGATNAARRFAALAGGDR